MYVCVQIKLLHGFCKLAVIDHLTHLKFVVHGAALDSKRDLGVGVVGLTADKHVIRGPYSMYQALITHESWKRICCGVAIDAFSLHQFRDK